MKKGLLISLLMVLPLVACTATPTDEGKKDDDTQDTGGEGTGGEGSGGEGGEGSGGGGGQKDPVEVKRSELLTVFSGIYNNFLEEDVSETGIEYWDKQYNCYSGEIMFEEASQNYRWETALLEFESVLPVGYVVEKEDKNAAWDDVKGIEKFYLVDDKITVDAFSYTDPDDSYVYIAFEVYTSNGNTFVNDIDDSKKTVTVAFLNSTGFTGSFENGNAETFVTWFNGQAAVEGLLTSVTIAAGSYVQMKDNVGDLSKQTALWLGSSSTYGDITFNFSKSVTHVKVGVQPYWKSYNNGGYSGFNVSKSANIRINNEEQLIDLSTTVTDSEPASTDIERDYAGIKSFNLQNEGTGDSRVFINYLTITFVA